jgi:hypothetical protein
MVNSEGRLQINAYRCSPLVINVSMQGIKEERQSVVIWSVGNRVVVQPLRESSGGLDMQIGSLLFPIPEQAFDQGLVQALDTFD